MNSTFLYKICFPFLALLDLPHLFPDCNFSIFKGSSYMENKSAKWVFKFCSRVNVILAGLYMPVVVHQG